MAAFSSSFFVRILSKCDPDGRYSSAINQMNFQVVHLAFSMSLENQDYSLSWHFTFVAGPQLFQATQGLASIENYCSITVASVVTFLKELFNL